MIGNDKEILAPLIDRLMELSMRPQEEFKKTLWSVHQSGVKASKTPVTVYYEGIPFKAWEQVFGENWLGCGTELGRAVEFDLRRRIWVAENVPDDHIVWPMFILPAPNKWTRDWNVPLVWKESDDELGAQGYNPPMSDGIDLSRLTVPLVEVDEPGAGRLLAQAEELLAGRIAVQMHYPLISYSPFDLAVEMRGMDSICLDIIDCPEKVHGLMDFITGAIVGHQHMRQEKGWINCHADPTGRYQAIGFRVHCAALPQRINSGGLGLVDEWAYISAQTSACLGPAQYEEFVHRYNARLAKLFSERTVYYHGCECLDRKIGIIAGLPNLRRFHVSPWSSVERAREQFRDSGVVLEVHSHPGKVLFGQTEAEVKADLAVLISQAEGVPLDLNLSDINTFNGRPESIISWARLAQEAAENIS
ncbi:MAG: hypothetical protein PHT33_02235 [bacterium]|nr:hypothetical protein [bacterium]